MIEKVKDFVKMYGQLMMAESDLRQNMVEQLFYAWSGELNPDEEQATLNLLADFFFPPEDKKS